MVEAHNAVVREQFRLQAATFTDDGFAARGLDWIVDELPLSPTDVVLDVASGAMHLARAVAPHAAHVCAIDLTPEMLEMGVQLAARSGLRNVTASVGDASSLPWVDRQFDLVMCRLTLHQVGDPAGVVNEMVRVTRAGGTIAVIDMIVDDDPATAAESNRLERLRDPSHNTTLTEAEIAATLTAAGAQIQSCTVRDQPLDLDDWLDRTQTPARARHEVIDRFEAELSGGTPTGLHPLRAAGGGWSFSHRWVMLVCGRPDER